jgi:mannosylglycoprotein endo-beta-mannosidase
MPVRPGFPDGCPDICHRTMNRHLKSLLVAVAGIASAQAETGTETTISLRSPEFHKGTHPWSMCREADAKTGGEAISQPGFQAAAWSKAIVPGTVLNSLVANGVYPEPYFGLNNAHERELIPDISEVGRDFYTYWFRTEFEVPADFAGKQVWLEFEGVNQKAEIWLNGERLGELAGMFQRGVFNATELAKPGETNALAVLVHPVEHPGGFRQKDKTVRAAGENRNGGDGEIGRNTTMLMTVGWDFTFTDGIRDRNTGIWKDVKLYATGPVALRHAFVKSELPVPALAPARETISVDVINATDRPQSGDLTAVVGEADIKVRKAVSLKPGETLSVEFTPEEFRQLVIAKPRLWWPVHKGEQFLHTLELEFSQDGAVSDKMSRRFGIRDIRTNRETPDKSRQFIVNGKRLFLHGTNWVPEAMCRNSSERTRAELRYTRQSGVNFIRQWGGGITESDEFYELCDEYGILVWTEFWQTGDTQLPNDRELHRANVSDTIRRIRHHACQAFYVSANERNEKTIVPIRDIVEKLHPGCDYLEASEIGGIHDGSPYLVENPMFHYEDSASKRGGRINGLCPEYGTPTLPTVDCLREMMDEKDLWPINKTVWDYLDGGGFHRMTINFDRGVSHYGPSSGIEEYAMKGQAFGGLCYRSIWECWNANKFDYGDRFATGLLFWYHNSPNRQVCGRLYDWSLEPTSALYFSQDAHEPLHAQMDFLKNTVAVNNEYPRDFRGTVIARVLDFNMKEVSRRSAQVNVAADAVSNGVLSIEFPRDITPVHFIKLELANAKGEPVSDTFYWRSNKEYKPKRTWTGPQLEGFEDLAKLPKVKPASKVEWSREGDENVATVSVKNTSRELAFMVWLRLQDETTGKPVRPAFYDDNFFSLLPGEMRKIRVCFGDNAAPEKARLVVDGWNIEAVSHGKP